MSSKQFACLWILLPVFLGACSAGPPTRPDDVCSIFEEKRGWHSVSTKAQKKWGTSMHIPLAIMNQESSFKKNARPPRRYILWIIPWKRPSSAFGYAQAIDGTWRSYTNATGEYWRERSNYRDATDFIHWYIRQAVKRNGVSDRDAYSLYLNYHEGITGFARGSYKQKKWLLNTAKKVQNRANTYAAQYARCKDNLKTGFWGRLLGG